MIQIMKIPVDKCRPGYYVRWYYNGWHYWNFYSSVLGIKIAGQDYRTTGIRTVQLSSGPVNGDQIEAIRTLLNSRERYVFTDGGWSECRVESGNVTVIKNHIDAYEMECKIIIGSRAVSSLGYSVGITKPVFVPPNDGDITSPPMDVCEIIMGDQIWSCKNYDFNYPGSKVYANNEANAAIYGRLYTYAMIMQPDFCPAGWHIPTRDELMALNQYAGGVENKPGINLRSFGYTYWNSYIESTKGLDLFGFDWRGAGAYFKPPSSGAIFSSLKQSSYLWSSTLISGELFYMFTTYTATSAPVDQSWLSQLYASVRLIKNT